MQKKFTNATVTATPAQIRETEAVMAGALEVQLAGDAVYFGKVVKKPTIGDDIRRSRRKISKEQII